MILSVCVICLYFWKKQYKEEPKTKKKLLVMGEGKKKVKQIGIEARLL